VNAPLSLDQLLAIGSLAGIEIPIWEPDGSAVVIAAPLAGATELWSFPIDGTPPQRMTTGMGGVGHLASALPRFSPEGTYLCYVTGDIGETEVWLQPTDGAPPFPLTRLGANITSLCWMPDGASMLVSANRYGTYDVFRVSVPDGRHERLTSDARYEGYPSVTPDGSRLLHVRLDETWTEHDILSTPLDASSPGEVILHDEHFFDYHYGRYFGSAVPSPDGRTVLFRSYRSDWLNVWAVSIDGGEPWQIAPESADQDGAAWSPDGRSIVFTSNHDGAVALKVVDAAGGGLRTLVDPGDGVCAFPAWSPDGSHVAFTLATPVQPADLHVVEVATGDVRRLTRSVPASAEARLGRPERLRYRGEDGLEIPSLLYRPESIGVEPNGAGVVVVHGGPTMQWLPVFDGYAQYLLGRGYTLLLPNIRGSSGYGRSFEEANDRDWCGGDLRDVVRGAGFLRDLGTLDPDRMAITGLSYGGIMSMAAVSFAPGEFQAAASLSGYGDFLGMMDEQEVRHQQLLRKELGDPVADREVYVRASAIHAVRAATTPAFIAHGVGRFPSSDAGRDFAEALEREYKTVEYRTYPDEHYYVMGRDNLRQLWQDVDAFFSTYLDLDA
jgi:dipeptidyl aminopeptidase/acylaminoacyl peptidase